MYIRILFVLCFSVQYTFAQKIQLTDTSYKNWTNVTNGAISNDGRYVVYDILNKPKDHRTSVIISTDKTWKKELLDYETPRFSQNSKYAFAKRSDTLLQVQTGGKAVFAIPGCTSFKLISDGKEEWLVYQQKTTINQTIVRNLSSGSLDEYPDVVSSLSNSTSASILLKYKQGGQGKLVWLDLKSGVQKEIYSGANPLNTILDQSGTRLAFKTQENGFNKLWYYQVGDQTCKVVCTDTSEAIQPSNIIKTAEYWTFSQNGQYLFFTQENKRIAKDKDAKAPVIWSYQDGYLAPFYDVHKDGIARGKNLTLVDLKDFRVRQLLNGQYKPETVPGANGDLVLVSMDKGDVGDQFWNQEYRRSYYALSLKSGQLTPIQMQADLNFTYSVSCSGKYLVFDNLIDDSIRVYSSKNNKIYTLATYGNKFRPHAFTHIDYKPTMKFFGWTNKEKLLAQDEYDIWSLDPENRTTPNCLTQGKGKATRTVYFFAKDFPSDLISEIGTYEVLGFNVSSKQYSINEIKIKKRNFRPIVNDAGYIVLPNSSTSETILSRAQNGEGYLIKQQSASRSPNYIFTNDFRAKVELSAEYPEEKFNWFTTELLKYKDSAGQQYDAILYKPDNFDSTKHYPVIFFYYHASSQELNMFLSPEPVMATINIPLMLQAGYVVVRPDIIFRKGLPGQSFLNSITAAANCLERFSYVDSKKMGIVGHSLAGFGTNYVATHSKRFAAVLSGAGISNTIQMSNELWGDGASMLPYMMSMMGFPQPLKNLPQAFIDDAPILSANNVTSPMLIVHNNEDDRAQVSHSIQLFVQLRRLKKPAWLIQYPGERHNISETSNQLDYQHRVFGFFNYYLKDESMPDWMSKHNPY